MNEQKKTKEPIFNIDDRGYNLKAWYLELDGKIAADALVEIRWQERLIILRKWPAYKIYNIAAHFSDIVDVRLETEETIFLDEPVPVSRFTVTSKFDAVLFLDNGKAMSAEKTLSLLINGARYQDELATANNEFGSETAEWPDLWRRIAEMKEHNGVLQRQNQALRSNFGQLWSWMADVDCSFNIAEPVLIQRFFTDYPGLESWFNNPRNFK